MTQYNTTTVYQLLQSDTDPTVFTVVAGSSVPYVIKNQDPAAQFFEVNDTITATSVVGDYTGTYLGHTPAGIIVSIEGAPYYFGTEGFLFEDTVMMVAGPFPVCFVKGTLITTSNGPVAIEHLTPGDTVMCSTGWREVKWLGWRHYGPACFLSKESTTRIAPVRIKAHAFADNVPDRDLLTSPWHHLLVDGKLVRAHDLINGMTVVQETGVSEVSYYHVELDQFDVIMAHGIYSESWADGGNRDFFQNVDVTTLRPEDMKRRRAPRPGFDHLVLRKGSELSAIQRRVTDRAQALSMSLKAMQQAA